MIMSNAWPDHPRDRRGEPINACSIEVQQPQRTWLTATNVYHLCQEREDLQRSCRH